MGAAFSSVSVLNASFRRVPSVPGIPLGSTAESSGVDLLKVTLEQMVSFEIFKQMEVYNILYIISNPHGMCMYIIYTHTFSLDVGTTE